MKLQQRLSKKKKGSSNFKKLKKRINKLHRKIANIRQDSLQQVSTDISKNHALVVLEYLKVASMSKSASGTTEHPGTMVAAKSGLNRSILDQGWHALKNMLSYKLNHLGGELLVVDPRYTSQKCSTCGHTKKENRMSQAQFACVQCGHHYFCLSLANFDCYSFSREHFRDCRYSIPHRDTVKMGNLCHIRVGFFIV